MVTILDKEKALRYTVDFVTALPVDACLARLENDTLPPRHLGGALVPMRQDVFVRPNGMFMIERTFPGAIHPVRFSGSLDPDEPSGGTWVHGGVTHDAGNQVMIEGLIVFVAFFLLTALLFFRLRTRALIITVPMLIVILMVMSLRWRVLRMAAEDIVRWVRRKLYVTADQVR